MEKINLVEYIDLDVIHDAIWEQEDFCRKDCTYFVCTDPGDYMTPMCHECELEYGDKKLCPGVVETMDVAYNMLTDTNGELAEMLVATTHPDLKNYAKAYRDEVFEKAKKAAAKIAPLLNDHDVMEYFKDDITEYLRGYF